MAAILLTTKYPKWKLLHFHWNFIAVCSQSSTKTHISINSWNDLALKRTTAHCLNLIYLCKCATGDRPHMKSNHVHLLAMITASLKNDTKRSELTIPSRTLYYLELGKALLGKDTNKKLHRRNIIRGGGGGVWVQAWRWWWWWWWWWWWRGDGWLPIHALSSMTF